MEKDNKIVSVRLLFPTEMPLTPPKENDRVTVLYKVPFSEVTILFCIFFGGLQCVSHSFAYVSHLWFLRDVWIRTQSAAVASGRAADLAINPPNLATNPPNVATNPPLATNPPNAANNPPNLATNLPSYHTHPQLGTGRLAGKTCRWRLPDWCCWWCCRSCRAPPDRSPANSSTQFYFGCARGYSVSFPCSLLCCRKTWPQGAFHF